MKKKIIEGMEFLKLPKLNKKKGVEYIGRTAIQKVADEDCFFLEVYKNEKGCKDVPVVRIVVSTKDFGTFWPENGSWSRAQIESYTYDRPIWVEGYRTTRDEDKKMNALYSTEDLDRIKSFFKDSMVYNDSTWWVYIKKRQEDICSEERIKIREKAYERRKKALNDRIKNTPKLKEQKLLKYADNYIFKKKHYLYYKKKGRRADICCSKCGGVTSGLFKPGISYESNFLKKHIEEPRNKHWGICPLCHEAGIYKCQGRAGGDYRESVYIFLIDKYKETGVVIRYVELSKKWILQQIYEEKSLVMSGAYEELSGIEIARTYIHPKEKTQTDFHKNNPYSGKDFWDDCNLYGMNNIVINPTLVHPESWKNLEGTCLQYSQAEEFMKEVGSDKVALHKYMIGYIETPQIEMLVKLKMFGVVRKMVIDNYGIVADKNAKNPADFLGIKKERVKFLTSQKGNIEILQILKMEKQMGENWTEEQILKLAELEPVQCNLELALQFMTMQKLLNTIKKYAGCEYGTRCGQARGRIRNTATTYFDYLSMRSQLGYDLTNTVYQKPRDIGAAHNKMIVEINKDKQDKRLKEVAVKFPLIRKNYRRLRNKYFYDDGDFIIRPARSAEEIVMEGRILHHCVGGDSYLSSHNMESSIILVLRFKNQQEIPYITVEITGEKIIQWYGANDNKPDKENMERWLDSYTEMLKRRRLEAKESAEQKMMQPVLVQAG